MRNEVKKALKVHFLKLSLQPVFSAKVLNIAL